MTFPVHCYSAFKGKPLPEKQAKCLAYIRSEITSGRRFPSDHQIATHMGWKNDHSAYDCLKRLEWRGLVCVVGQSQRELVETRARSAAPEFDNEGASTP